MARKKKIENVVLSEEEDDILSKTFIKNFESLKKKKNKTEFDKWYIKVLPYQISYVKAMEETLKAMREKNQMGVNCGREKGVN